MALAIEVNRSEKHAANIITLPHAGASDAVAAGVGLVLRTTRQAHRCMFHLWVVLLLIEAVLSSRIPM